MLQQFAAVLLLVLVALTGCGVSRSHDEEKEGDANCLASGACPQQPADCRVEGAGCTAGEANCLASGACPEQPADCRGAAASCTAGFYCDLSDGRCRPGCARDEQCGATETCDLASRQCVCPAESFRCGAQCLAKTRRDFAACNNACVACPEKNALSVGCEGDVCVATKCEPGFRICKEGCCPWILQSVYTRPMQRDSSIQLATAADDSVMVAESSHEGDVRVYSQTDAGFVTEVRESLATPGLVATSVALRRSAGGVSRVLYIGIITTAGGGMTQGKTARLASKDSSGWTTETANARASDAWGNGFALDAAGEPLTLQAQGSSLLLRRKSGARWLEPQSFTIEGLPFHLTLTSSAGGIQFLSVLKNRLRLVERSEAGALTYQDITGELSDLSGARLARDNAGGLHATYRLDEPGKSVLMYAFRAPGAATWQLEKVREFSMWSADDLALDAKGRPHLCISRWYSNSELKQTQEIYHLFRRAPGEWPSHRINASVSNDSACAIATDASGAPIVAFSRENSLEIAR